MSEKQETPKIKYFEKFLSNVSQIRIIGSPDPVIVKELVAAMSKYSGK